MATLWIISILRTREFRELIKFHKIEEVKGTLLEILDLLKTPNPQLKTSFLKVSTYWKELERRELREGKDESERRWRRMEWG